MPFTAATLDLIEHKVHTNFQTLQFLLHIDITLWGNLVEFFFSWTFRTFFMFFFLSVGTFFIGKSLFYPGKYFEWNIPSHLFNRMMNQFSGKKNWARNFNALTRVHYQPCHNMFFIWINSINMAHWCIHLCDCSNCPQQQKKPIIGSFLFARGHFWQITKKAVGFMLILVLILRVVCSFNTQIQFVPLLKWYHVDDIIRSPGD